MVDFLIQSAAALGLFYGLWQAGNIRLRGPFFAMLAEVFTVAVGIMHEAWSIWVIGGVLFFVQGRNFLKWKKEGAGW